MGIFRRRPKAEQPPAPVTIDLGLWPVFQVQVLVASLEDQGIRAFLIEQRETPRAGDLAPKHCRVLVAPEDEEAARAHFVHAGLL